MKQTAKELKANADMNRRFKRYCNSKEHRVFLSQVHNRYIKHLWDDCNDQRNVVGVVVKKGLYEEVLAALSPQTRFISTQVGGLDNIMLMGKAICSEKAHE